MHGGRIYLSEINTIPGFTPISLFPILCREGGYDFGGICERIVELAVERAARASDSAPPSGGPAVSGSAPRTTIGRGARRPTPLVRRASAGPVAGRVVAGLVLVAPRRRSTA